MSSGLMSNPALGGQTAMAAGAQVMEKVARLGMTPRQQELNRLWAYYKTLQYDARAIDWDGKPVVKGVEAEAIASQGFIPPGYYDAGASLPLKFRRPTAPYHLIKVIVDRFTGLLFSERRHPKVRVEGDVDTEDYVHAMVEAARLWPSMIQARTYGGSTGTVAVGFQFLEGKPVVEVHDPRWLYPDFIDRSTMKLHSIEKRFIYPIEMRDEETGAWVEVAHWYRRVITETQDVLYKPIPVADGQEPDWMNPDLVQSSVEHNLGFCPVVWVQNLPALDDIDGDPDCTGVYDLVETIDVLLSQAKLGTVANSDPTLVINTDAPLPNISKGSDNAIKLPANSSAKYMEISGSGPQAARELAQELRTYALEVAQCVLDHPDIASRTATEIERVYSSMLSKANILREQYGERCVKPLLAMMLQAVRKLGTARVSESGQIERQEIVLPLRKVDNGDGSFSYVQRQLGQNKAQVELDWPSYFETTPQDAQQAVQAAAAAKAAALIDTKHATAYIANYFNVEDVPAMMEEMRKEHEASQTGGLPMDMLAQLQASEPAPEEAPAEEGDSAEPEERVNFFQYELDAGGVTINEWRASKNLEPLAEDGDLTFPAYKAKFADIFAAQTAVDNSGTAADILGIVKDAGKAQSATPDRSQEE